MVHRTCHTSRAHKLRSVARSVPLQTKELSALPLYGTSLESAQKGWVIVEMALYLDNARSYLSG